MTPAPKRPPCFLPSVLGAALLLAAAPGLHAATFTKADNTTALNTGASWVGGVVPAGTDLVLLDNTLTANRSVATGANITWLGLQATTTNAAAQLFTITGNTVTLGASGIDMTSTSMNVTISAAVALGANQTWATSSNTTRVLAVSGVVSGVGFGIVKSGDSQLTLSGANTFTGGVTHNQGRLNINNAAALGAGVFTMADGVTIDTTAATTTVTGLGGQIWNGSFTYLGSNTSNLSLSLGTSAVALNNNSTITVANAATTLTVAGSINGTFGLTKNGPGNLTLSGNSSDGYSGGVTVNAGALNINNAGALGTGPLTLAGGNINNNSGAGLTLVTNNAQAWNSDFTFVGTNSLNLGTGPVTLGGNRILTVSASNFTVGGAISGSGFGITKAGPGTLILTGASTFGGGVTLNAGTINIQNANALGTGPLTIGAAGVTLSNSSGGAIVLSTNNSQIWNADFTFAGPNSLNLGTGSVALNATRILTANASTLTVGGVISGVGFGLTKAGAGTLVLSGNNLFTGDMTLQSGTLSLGNGGAIGTGNLILNGGFLANSSGGNLTLTNNNHIVVNAGFGYAGPNNLNLGTNLVDLISFADINVAAGSTLTIGGSILGSGTGLSKSGPGTLVLAGNNSVAGAYNGGTTVSVGTLIFSTLDSISPGTGTLVSISGTSDPTVGFDFAIDQSVLTRILPTADLFTVAIGANSSSPLDFSDFGAFLLGASLGVIEGKSASFSGALVPNGTTYRLGGGGGTLTMTVNNVLSGEGNDLVVKGPGTVILPASNSYGGGTTIGGGTLEFPTLASLGSGGIAINGGILRYGASNAADISSRTLTFGPAGASIDTNGNDVTYANSIGNGGTGNFTKRGNGNMTLNSVVSYTGNTSVAGGRLILTTSEMLPDAANLSLVTGGILDLGANNETVAAVNVVDGSILGTGTVTASSYVVGNGTVSVNLSGNTALLKNTTGAVILTGTNTYTGITTLNGGTVEFATLANLGANSTIDFNGGGLRWASGSTTDVSARTTFFAAGGATFDTNGNNVVLANAIGGSGTGSFTKTGNGI